MSAADNTDDRPQRRGHGPNWELRRQRFAALTDAGVNPDAYAVDPAIGYWLWRRSCKRDRVPQAGYRGRAVCPARHVYERAVGPLPPSHTLVPACGRPDCINPAHQHPVPRGERQRLVDAAKIKPDAATAAAVRAAAPTRTFADLAARFGLSDKTMGADALRRAAVGVFLHALDRRTTG